MLKIKGIYKSYGNFEVLKNCNLEVNESSIFGLVGIKGAGKSTLLRAIAGIYDVDAGQILFNDYDVSRDEKIRKDILLIADENEFDKNATIESLKLFFKNFYDFDEVAYEKYLKMFGLDTKKPIISFSKGMQRQAMLLFALAIRPKLLLLDEAFDGLDPLVRLNFKKALAELIEDNEITVIISSHNLKELEDICDSFGILENGFIKTSGDLSASKDLVNKYQIVYEDNKDETFFKDFDLLYFNKIGRVITAVIRGDKSEVYQKLEATKPMMIDVLAVNFEELFIYEVESRGTLDE